MNAVVEAEEEEVEVVEEEDENWINALGAGGGGGGGAVDAVETFDKEEDGDGGKGRVNNYVSEHESDDSVSSEDGDEDEDEYCSLYDDEAEEDDGEEEGYEYDDDDNSALLANTSAMDVFDASTLKHALLRLEMDDDELRELVVHCSSMTRESAAEFALCLPQSTHLKKLRLVLRGGGSGSGSDEGKRRSSSARRDADMDVFHKVLSGVEENASIDDLEVRGATIDRESSGWLVPCLAVDKKLRRVCLSDCRFVGCGLAALVVAMQHNRGGMRELEFRTCEWDAHNADTVACSLPHLNLHSLSLVGVSIAPDAWSHLFQNVGRSRDLVSLDLSGNRLDMAVVQSLTATLAAHGSISSLGLSRCGLNDRTARALASGLAGIAAMRTIDLSRNDDMTDAVVVYLNKLLSLNKSITELNAHGCGFCGRSMGAIKDKLRYNNSFVKAFFSEATSRVIFRVVDVIQKAEEDVLLTSLKELKRCH